MTQTLNQAGAFVQGRGPTSLGLLSQSCSPRGPHQARAAESAAAGPCRGQGCDRKPGARPAPTPQAEGRGAGGGARAWGLCRRRHQLRGDVALTMAESGHAASSLRDAEPCRYRQSPRNLGGRLRIPRWWSDDVSGTKAPARPQKPAPYSRSLRLIARFSSLRLRLDRASVLTGSDPE